MKILRKSGKIRKPDTFPEKNFIISFLRSKTKLSKELWLKPLKSEDL